MAVVKIMGVIICIFCRIPGVGLEIKCVVSGDWTGEDITAIFYEFNNGPLAIGEHMCLLQYIHDTWQTQHII